MSKSGWPVPKRIEVIFVTIVAALSLTFALVALLGGRWVSALDSGAVGALSLWLTLELQARRTEHGL